MRIPPTDEHMNQYLDSLRRVMQRGDTSGTGSGSTHAHARMSAFTQAMLDATPLPVDLIHIIDEYRVSPHLPVWVSPPVPMAYADPHSIPFNTLTCRAVDGGMDALSGVLVHGWCIRAVIGHSARFFTHMQLVYGPPHLTLTHDDLRTQSHMHTGVLVSRDDVPSHLPADELIFPLHAYEWIDQLEIEYSTTIDGVLVHTSMGRSWCIGQSVGLTRCEVRAPPHAALIGVMGRVDSEFTHQLSAVFASTMRHPRITPAVLRGEASEECVGVGGVCICV